MPERNKSALPSERGVFSPTHCVYSALDFRPSGVSLPPVFAVARSSAGWLMAPSCTPRWLETRVTSPVCGSMTAAVPETVLTRSLGRFSKSVLFIPAS
jgi:hypothetical protein